LSTPPLFSQRAEAAAAAERKAAAEAEASAADPLADRYGDAPLVASQAKTGRVWRRIADLSESEAGQTVLVRARVATVRGKGKSCFLVLRQRTDTIQVRGAKEGRGRDGGASFHPVPSISQPHHFFIAPPLFYNQQLVLFSDDVTISRNMVKYASNLPRETVVDVEGVVTVPASPVSGCSQTGIELKGATVRAISRAEPLPFDLADAARPDTTEEGGDASAAASGPMVAIDTRLDARVVDLRVPAMQAIFSLQAGVGRLFRSTMDGLGFQEIHSPCLIAGASEGGAACFRLDYCGRPACLAQSPQLYKQMALCADFERVYEVTPVFRAEKSFTHRHLTEFTGLDFEMCINEHYDEVRGWRERKRRVVGTRACVLCIACLIFSFLPAASRSWTSSTPCSSPSSTASTPPPPGSWASSPPNTLSSPCGTCAKPCACPSRRGSACWWPTGTPSLTRWPT
jgi:aspartyl-tRNA synthetase